MGGSNPCGADARRRTLPQLNVQEAVSLSFSSDGRLLGGGPEHTLGLWAWDKSKLPAQCLLSPGLQQVSVVGDGLWRTFRIEGGLAPKPAPPLPLGKRDSPR